MNTDPRKTIDQSPMSLLQIFIIAITVGLNGLDGIDVLSISFALDGIGKEWGMTHGGLGIVSSMELFGMAVGSIAIGWVADVIGRRKTMIGCLITMALGMFMDDRKQCLSVVSVENHNRTGHRRSVVSHYRYNR